MATTREQFFRLLKKISDQLDRPPVVSVNPRVSVAAANLQPVLAELETLSSLISTTNGHVDGLEGFVDEIEGFVDGVETLLTAIDAKLATIDTSLNGIESDADAIRLTNVDIEANTTGLGTQVTLAAISASLVLILSKLNAIEDNLSAATVVVTITFTGPTVTKQVMSLASGFTFEIMAVHKSNTDSGSVDVAFTLENGSDICALFQDQVGAGETGASWANIFQWAEQARIVLSRLVLDSDTELGLEPDSITASDIVEYKFFMVRRPSHT